MEDEWYGEGGEYSYEEEFQGGEWTPRCPLCRALELAKEFAAMEWNGFLAGADPARVGLVEGEGQAGAILGRLTLLAGGAGRVIGGPSAAWGRTIADFQGNPQAWVRMSAHAEAATGRAFRGGTSMEEVFMRGDQYLVRHRIYGPGGDMLKESFRPWARFGT